MPLTLDPAPSARIAAQARQVRPGQVVLIVVTFMLSGIGWVAAQIWFGLVFTALAVADGWQQAYEKQVTRRGPARSD